MRAARPAPLEAHVDAQGALYLAGSVVTADELGQVSAATGRPVELRVDQNAMAARLLDIHATLQLYDSPATFLVEFHGNP